MVMDMGSIVARDKGQAGEVTQPQLVTVDGSLSGEREWRVLCIFLLNEQKG